MVSPLLGIPKEEVVLILSHESITLVPLNKEPHEPKVYSIGGHAIVPKSVEQSKMEEENSSPGTSDSKSVDQFDLYLVKRDEPTYNSSTNVTSDAHSAVLEWNIDVADRGHNPQVDEKKSSSMEVALVLHCNYAQHNQLVEISNSCFFDKHVDGFFNSFS